MASISASPNPVGVYSAGGRGSTTITYDLRPELQLGGGTLHVSDGVMQEDIVLNLPFGAIDYAKIEYGKTYTFTLRSGSSDLASTMVTTFDLRQQLAAGFSQAYVPQLRPQMITNLVVKPGIDTVRISFRTTLPTIPLTEIRDHNGTYVDGRMPLFGGRRTRHEVMFGLETPLALNEKHSFKIEAFGSTKNPSSPNKAVVTGEFITGTRNVDVMYEMLDVHDDGDSTGAGEFTFAFAVGDVETGAPLGNPGFLSRDISDKDPPIDLGITLPLTDVHRQIWLEVIAHEDDGDFWRGLHAVGIRPERFDGAGGKYSDDGQLEIVDLTIVMDVDTDPGRWMIPFELRTGDWPVDFVVAGHLGVEAIEGSVISTKIGKLGPPSQSSTFLTEPGSIARLAVGGVGERTEEVALGGDGAFYRRSIKRERSKLGGGSEWTRVELPGRGTPAVAAVGDAFDLVDLDERGGVLHGRYDPSRPKAPKWRRLGGNFAHVVPAVTPGKGKGAEAGLVLFGLADDGDLFVRDVSDEGRDWTRLGDGPVGAVTVVTVPGVGAVLFAMGEDRLLRCFMKKGGRWRAQAVEKPARGDRPPQSLTAVVIETAGEQGSKGMRREVVIGALSDDQRVQTLRWPDFPSDPPATGWEDAGTVQGLLVAPKTRAAPRRGTKAKSSKRTR
jgi:hypothetical protein